MSALRASYVYRLIEDWSGPVNLLERHRNEFLLICVKEWYDNRMMQHFCFQFKAHMVVIISYFRQCSSTSASCCDKPASKDEVDVYIMATIASTILHGPIMALKPLNSSFFHLITSTPSCSTGIPITSEQQAPV